MARNRLVVLVILVCPAVVSCFIQCTDDEIFCISTGQCIKQNSDCFKQNKNIVGGCQQDEVFCLETGKCIKVEKSCSDGKTIHQCADDEQFCLFAGKCVKREVNCFPATSDICPFGTTKCLQTGECKVIEHTFCDQDKSSKSIMCLDHEVFCLQKGQCVSTTDISCKKDADEDENQICPEGTTKCLRTGECIDRNSNCNNDQSHSTLMCNDKEVLCLNSEQCRPKENSCVTNNEGTSCPEGTVYCLLSGMCINLHRNCNDQSKQCSENEVFCLERGYCIEKEALCDPSPSESNDDSIYQCKTNEIFCIHSGHCIPKDMTCDFQPGEGTNHQCNEDEIFCLQRGICVAREKTCDYNTDTVTSDQCNEGELFCLNEGKCVSKENICDSPSIGDHSSHQCRGDEMFCLQREQCVPKLPECNQELDDDQVTICPTGKIKCLQTGKCVSICHEGFIDSSNTGSCPNGHVKCLLTGECVRLSEQPSVCESIEFNTRNCPPDQIMCLLTGKCVPNSKICDNTATSTGSNTCHDGEMMCLQSGKCVSATSGCKAVIEDATTSTSDYNRLSTTESSDFTATGNTQSTNYGVSVTQENNSSMSGWNATHSEIPSLETTTWTMTTTDPVLPITDVYHKLLPEPLFLYEDYLFIVNDTLGEYGIESEMKINCTDNVKLQNSTGDSLITAGTPVTTQRYVILTLISGGDGLCRIHSQDKPRSVYFMYIKMIEELYKADVDFAMTEVEIEEDTHFLYFTDWKMWYNITINDDAVDISTFALTNESRKEFVDTYKEKLFQHHILHGINSHLKLQQVPLNEYGVPVAILEVHDGSKWTPYVMKYTSVDIIKHNYRIKFTESCNCQFNVELLHPGATSDNDLMVIKVMAVNDAPVLTDRAILRYNELVETYLLYPYVHLDADFRISDIVPHFYSDEDEHGIIGTAVIGQISDKIGKWMFLHNSSWTSFPYIDKSDLPGRSNINVHLLVPDDIIRFVPYNSSYLWTRHEAIAYTRLYLLGWDMSNSNNETSVTDSVDIHKCHGVHNKICGPGGKSAFGRDVIALYINRVGCDGMASSLMSADSCGICGGHDDCIDCTGTPNGGASYDMCRDCTGGSSNIPYGHHLDCNHECGNNYYEQRLQMCVRNGTDVHGLLTMMSCDSMLNSGAYINKCGHCVSGNTSLPSNHGEDVCGVCNGDGTSCLDCDGVVNGNKKEDFCGQCLHPSDSNYNKGCMKLGSVSPNYLRNFDNHTLHVVGVKLDMFSTVECSLHKHNDITLSVLSFDNTTSTIELQTPDLLGTRGEYNISCLFDSNTTLVLENELTIYQYPHIRSITPDSMVIGDMVKVNITTDGVVDTGFTQCILLCPFRSPEIGCYTASGFSKVHIPIVLLNSKTVQCDLSQLRYFTRAKAYKILVAVEQKEILDLSRLQSSDFIIRAEAPVIQAAIFDRSFCYFSIIFNRDITGPNECSDIFHLDTYNLLGTDPHCITVGKRVLVDLGRDNTLRPGHTITLKTSAIYRIGAMQQYAKFATGSTNISTPVNAMHPEFSLTGPSVVGRCESFNVVLKQTNSGCIKLRSHWSIQANQVLAPGNTSWDNSTSFTSLMHKVNSLKNSPRMLAIHHDEIQPGENVEFSVTVEDDLNGLSYVARHNVSREMTMNPLSVSLMLLGNTAHVDPANIIRFYATAKVPECYNLTEEIVKFSWQSGTSDFSLSVFNDKPISAIRPNTLRGGSMYTVTINAFFEDDPTAEAVDFVTFHTISKPLAVTIDGGDFMVFATHQEVVLDAGISQDPDRQNLPKFFTWTCEYENGYPCLILHGNDTVHMSSVFTFNERIVIPANTLAVGDKMMWIVTMTVGQRTGNFTTTVEIVNVFPPSLVLQLTNIIVNPGDKLRIPCAVTSHGPVMMMWSSSSDNGFDSIDLSTILPSESILQESTESVTNKDFSLFLDLSGIATLPAGATFVFIVTAFALDNEQSSTQRVHVTVNSPPTTGDIQISPSNGTSMTTDFTIDVGDGWTDIDGDSTVFFFSVKESNLGRIRLNARGLSDVYSYMFKLTEGIYDVIVELCDTYGACSNVNLKAAITVLGKTFTEAEIDQAAASITATLKTDMNAAIRMAMTMSSLLVSDDQNSTGSVSLVINEVATSLFISVVAAIDPADATSVLDSANNMLQRLADTGGLAHTVITESQSLASSLAAYVTTGTDQTRRRKKRTTTVIVTPLPINDAAILLTTYSATYSQQSEDSISTNSATDYHQALDNIFIGLCATVAYAEDPVVISSELSTINIDKRVTDNTASLVYDVTCKNCTSFITHPAEVTYGISIQNKYESWDCSPYLSCYGACFITAQLTKDLVTPTSPSEMSLTNRVRRSDIIILKVINPVENSILTVGNLDTPITITIRVDGDVNTTAYSLQCLFWNHASWTNSTCTASSPHMIELVTAVTCSCDTMGYIAVFEGPPIIETIILTSTESSMETETVPVHEETTETIISIPSSAEAVQVSFTIDTDYAIIVDHVQFRNEIKQKLADTMHVMVKRITYLSVESGSIIVTFKVEHGSISETTLQVAVEKLLAAIMSNSLAITNHHGGPLKIIKASFTYEVVDKDPVPEEENPSTLYIILGCVGALLVIAVVVIAVLLHKMKKDHTAVSTSPPPPYGPQMHGVDVPRPVSSGSKKFLVQERTNAKTKPSNDNKHGYGKMYDTGHGSAMKDVDIVAIEKGAGIQGGAYGQPGEKWTEIEIRPHSKPGSATSVPGPPNYLPPITG